jgi:hypothetical protein
MVSTSGFRRSSRQAIEQRYGALQKLWGKLISRIREQVSEESTVQDVASRAISVIEGCPVTARFHDGGWILWSPADCLGGCRDSRWIGIPVLRPTNQDFGNQTRPSLSVTHWIINQFQSLGHAPSPVSPPQVNFECPTTLPRTGQPFSARMRNPVPGTDSHLSNQHLPCIVKVLHR